MLADEISDVPNLGMNSYPTVRLGVVFAEISKADHVAFLCFRRHRVSCSGGPGVSRWWSDITKQVVDDVPPVPSAPKSASLEVETEQTYCLSE